MTLGRNHKARQRPGLRFKNGDHAYVLRRKLGMNQAAFQGRISVTASGGSRYELGRNISAPVKLLLHITCVSKREL